MGTRLGGESSASRETSVIASRGYKVPARAGFVGGGAKTKYPEPKDSDGGLGQKRGRTRPEGRPAEG
jgi:hypothetical protein